MLDMCKMCWSMLFHRTDCKFIALLLARSRKFFGGTWAKENCGARPEQWWTMASCWLHFKCMYVQITISILPSCGFSLPSSSAQTVKLLHRHISWRIPNLWLRWCGYYDYPYPDIRKNMQLDKSAIKLPQCDRFKKLKNAPVHTSDEISRHWAEFQILCTF